MGRLSDHPARRLSGESIEALEEQVVVLKLLAATQNTGTVTVQIGEETREENLRGTAVVSPIAPGNVQVHWPEGNVLISERRRSAEAGIPDYNARVSVEPASP